MPKIVAQKELDRIALMVSQHQEGIGIEALLQALGSGMPRRTLQRRLSLLLEQGRIQTTGNGRGLRYLQYRGAAHVPALPATAAGQIATATYVPESTRLFAWQTPASGVPVEAYLPVSREGNEIKAYVRQPRHLRKPVGYNIAFLEQYHPNETAYLPQGLRDQLHGLGRSPAAQTPAGTFARDILNRLLIDLSWASSQLEGNTYSRLDTERLIEHGQAAEGKDALETQMILNHKDAIEFLVRDTEHAYLATGTVIALHAFLSDGLLADPGACGRVRTRAVEIGGSVYLPIALPQRLDELFHITVAMAAEIQDPFEQAFFLMVHLPYLQPFEDVNKRVSRLAANIPLIRHNLCPLSFIDVPQQAYVDGMIGVYELNRVDLLRDVFVWAYERSCQQYVAVKQNLVPPDIFRLRYRQQLGEVVAAIVRNGEPANESTVRARMTAAVADADMEHFFALVLGEFKTLHAGNAVRFGLRPLEFSAWQEKQPGRG